MDVLLIVMLTIAALVVVGMALAGRKEDPIEHSLRPTASKPIRERPVFLGHDQHWTPAVTPDLPAASARGESEEIPVPSLETEEESAAR